MIKVQRVVSLHLRCPSSVCVLLLAVYWPPRKKIIVRHSFSSTVCVQPATFNSSQPARFPSKRRVKTTTTLQHSTVAAGAVQGIEQYVHLLVDLA